MLGSDEFWHRLRAEIVKERGERIKALADGSVSVERYREEVGRIAGLGFTLDAAHRVMREMNGAPGEEAAPESDDDPEGFRDPFEEE